jgi:hypothetical protein
MVLTRGCLRASPGGRPRTVTARRGCPPVDARRLLCAGFRQCGSLMILLLLFLQKQSLEDVRCGVSLVAGGCLPLVRGGGVFHAVGGGLRLGVALVDVRLDVVPLPPRSSSQTVAGCQVGGFPVGHDLWGGERVVGGVLPRISISDGVCVTVYV